MTKGQYASSFANGHYCYAELAVSSLAVSKTITHHQYSLCLPIEGWPSSVGLDCWLTYYGCMPTQRWSSSGGAVLVATFILAVILHVQYLLLQKKIRVVLKVF